MKAALLSSSLVYLKNCRFRNPVRRNAWERGWLESERERGEHESIKAMSEAEKADTRQKLSALKEMIGG
jgi:hypothetical protein